MSVVTTARISLADLNDAIVSTTEPKNPVDGTLWIDQDSSSGNYILKKWNASKSKWGIVGQLDPQLAETIKQAKKEAEKDSNDYTDRKTNEAESNAKQHAEDYANNMQEQIENNIGEVDNSLGDLRNYIDNEFEEGVINKTEAQSLGQYLNTLKTDKGYLDKQYTNIHGNSDLDDKVKSNLKTIKDNYDTIHKSLTDKIQSIVGAGEVTDKDLTEIDTMFDDYNDELSDLSEHLTDATDNINQNKADKAEQSANQYADKIKSTIDESISNVSGSLDDLEKYVDGDLQTGIIKKAEAQSVAKLLNNLKVDKKNLDGRYESISYNKYIGSSDKSDLESKKNDYDSVHKELMNKIKTVIENGEVTEKQSNEIDNKFTDYAEALSALQEAFEKSLDSISDNKAEEVRNDSKQYTDDSINDLHVGGTNFIRNSAFINGMDKWESEDAELENDSEDRNWVNVTNDDTSTDGEKVTQSGVPIDGDERYTLSFQAYNTQDSTYSGNLHFMFKQYDDIDKGLSTEEATMIMETDPKTYTYSFTTSSEATKADLVFEGEQSKKYDVYVSYIKLEKGDKATSWTPSPEDVQENIDTLTVKMDDVEQKVTDDSIVDTVTSSQTYINGIDSKADLTDLDEYSTKDELNEVDDELRGYVDGSIDDIDFEQYVTNAELERTAKDITGKFEASGGVNLLNNSVGFGGFKYWKGTKDDSDLSNVDILNNNQLDSLGFGSGFSFSDDGTKSRNLQQTVDVKNGSPYTLSAYIYKTKAKGDLDIQISDSDGNKIGHIEYKDGESNSDYESNFTTVYPTSNALTINIKADSNIDAVVTGLMLNIGDIPLQWSLASGEVYNTNVQMDLSGIRVSRLNEDGDEVGYTQMTPNEFAGYYDTSGSGDYEKVFYLQEDETVSKRFKAEDEFTMGNIKIVRSNSTARNGWAFVPNTDD